MSRLVDPPNSSDARWELLGQALTAKRLWLLIAAFEMALTLLSTLPGDVRKPVLNLTAGFLSSGALLAAIGCGWFLILRHISGRVRVLAAIPVIVLAGAARGIVLQWLLVGWGISTPGMAGYQYRIFSSLVVVITGATVGALVKVNVEAHRRRLEHLEALQSQLSLVLSQAEVQLRTDQSGAMARITSDLRQQLAQVRVASPEVAIDSLEHIAADVVRPLSHQLATAAPTWTPPETESLARHLDWSQVWAAIASPGAINPIGPALVVLAVTPSSVMALGLGRGLLLHVVAAALVYLGLWALQRTVPVLAPGRSTLVRLALTTALLLLACVPAAVATWLLSTEELRAVNTKYVLLVVPIVALMFAFIGAARAQQRATDQQAAALVEQTRWWVTRTRMVQWWQNGSLARALHGPMQSVIRAAAGRLRVVAVDGHAEPAVIHAVLADAAAALSQVLMDSRSGDDFQSHLENVAATWHPLARIEPDVDPLALEVINDDPVCEEILVDIIAEAVSNAVRHGGARHVRINVEFDADAGEAITAQIVDDGQGSPWLPDSTGLEVGLGTTQLRTCALDWTYESSPGDNLLSVALPVLRATRADVRAAN